MIVDPPVTPYDSAEELSAWLTELAAMPQDDTDVQEATRQAKDWLARASLPAARQPTAG